MRLGASLPEDGSKVTSKMQRYLKNLDDGQSKKKKQETVSELRSNITALLYTFRANFV